MQLKPIHQPEISCIWLLVCPQKKHKIRQGKPWGKPRGKPYLHAISSYKDHFNSFIASAPYFWENFEDHWSLSGPYFSCSCFFQNITDNWGKIEIVKVHGYEKSSLVLSKSMILCVRYSDSKFLMSLKIIYIFWPSTFPNPVLMIPKLRKFQYLVLIKVVLIRW